MHVMTKRFLGYALNNKAYCIYNLRNTVVDESIHFILDAKYNGIRREGFANIKTMIIMVIKIKQQKRANITCNNKFKTLIVRI